VTILFGVYLVLRLLYLVSCYVGVCKSEFCNVRLCVCMGFLMCVCMYIRVLLCVGVSTTCVLVFAAFLYTFVYIHIYFFLFSTGVMTIATQVQ
jgi:hypothetical protein